MEHLKIDTLQKLKDDGYRLWASCATTYKCSHYADLDLDALIKRFGPDFKFVERSAELDAAICCSKCGRKGVQVRLAAPWVGGADGAHSHSATLKPSS